MIIELNKLIYRSVESSLLDWIDSIPKRWIKRYLRVRFWLQWVFLGLCSVLAWLPEGAIAQNPNGTLPSYVPQSTSGLPGSASIGELQAISDATNSFDTLWDTYLSNNSPYFGVVLYSTRYIAIVGFTLWALSATWTWVQSDYKKFPWQTIFMPILIVVLFANNGQLTLIGLQAYKQLVYGANSFMLTSTYNGVSGKDLIKQANIREGLRDSYEKKSQSCIGKSPEVEDECIKEVEAEIKAASERLNEKNPGFNLDVGKTVTFAFQAVISSFLSLIAGIFHLIIAYVMAVWASSAPLWISMGLYPAGKSSLQIFASGLFAAALSVWLYTILQIALASQLNSNLGLHGILFPILGGVINPLVALFAGTMGFSAVMAAAGVASGAGIKLLKGLK